MSKAFKTIHVLKKAILSACCIGLITFSSGCKKDVVHQRSIAELNLKAQALMQAGDYAGATGRLEAAHDLQPDEPNTTRNLAIAYQMQGQYDKAIGMFTQLLDQFSGADKANIEKALGITYEAKADKLDADAKTLLEDAKGDKSKAQQVAQEATQAYQMAISYYKQAIAAEIKEAPQLQQQIAALEAKLKRGSGEVSP